MPKKTKAVKAEKPWLKKTSNFQYAVDTLEKKKRFLIICEGQTEEMYFKSFPVYTADVQSFAKGRSKTSLVNCITDDFEIEDYDEIWCVFDMDVKPGNNGQYDDFNNAITTAIKNGYKCAYSNDSFELWFVLHYQYLDQQQLRTFFFKVLSEKWDFNYEKIGKQKAVSSSIYQRLLDDPKANQSSAIKNAQKLHTTHKDKQFHLQNPVTTVYLLVEELNKHLRR